MGKTQMKPAPADPEGHPDEPQGAAPARLKQNHLLEICFTCQIELR